MNVAASKSAVIAKAGVTQAQSFCNPTVFRAAYAARYEFGRPDWVLDGIEAETVSVGAINRQRITP